ncbi:TPA: hypothetical protein JY344_001399 [Escherichia coli]|nr:hypothetical protein [Escherichia coli]HAW1333719.1 hypothetical protein [Escherichia coli]HAW9514026.1 hypothetical protein [Escherichia coli]
MIRDRQMAQPVVFPAPAGINRCASYKKLTINSVPRATSDRAANRAGVPRASGDKPRAPLATGVAVECSPRQRG